MKRRALWMLLPALLVIALLLAYREPLGRALFPDAALSGALARADAALAEGRLDDAVRLLSAAQARDPDHPRVADALRAARTMALDGAAAALDSGDVDRARVLLVQAAALGAPGDTLQALAVTLAGERLRDMDAVLQQAAELEASDPEAALALYGEVLGRDSAQAVARAGQRRIFGGWLDAAKTVLAGPTASAADVDAARRLLERVRADDPAHLGLPELQSLLVAYSVEVSAEVSGAGDVSEAARREASRWRGVAEEALGQGAWPRAADALKRAAVLDPDGAGQLALEQRLAAATGR